VKVDELKVTERENVHFFPNDKLLRRFITSTLCSFDNLTFDNLTFDNLPFGNFQLDIATLRHLLAQNHFWVPNFFTKLSLRLSAAGMRSSSLKKNSSNHFSFLSSFLVRLRAGPQFHRRTDQKEPLVRQGCQMVYFQTKNPNLGKFWRALECKRQRY
jgi:hypothetical protein